MLLHGRAFRGSPWLGFRACPGFGAPTLVMSKIRFLGVFRGDGRGGRRAKESPGTGGGLILRVTLKVSFCFV